MLTQLIVTDMFQKLKNMKGVGEEGINIELLGGEGVGSTCFQKGR